jgi:hypothetical protein
MFAGPICRLAQVLVQDNGKRDAELPRYGCEAVNRWSRNTYQWAYRFLAQRDGEHCVICGASKGKAQLEIDHIDGNPLNSHPDNLCLLCKKHNCQMRSKKAAEHKRIIERYRLQNESEREIALASPATHFAKEVLDYHNGSEEMKANSIFESSFVDWLNDRLTQDKEVPRKEVITGGAFHAGCSLLTTTRYLDKLTCENGPLYEATDAFGRKVVRLKTRKQSATSFGSTSSVKARSDRTTVDAPGDSEKDMPGGPSIL